MESSKIRLVPRGLKNLLEGVIQAVMEEKPDNITEFFALYFQELIAFQKGHPNLDIREVVNKFKFISENENEGLEEKTLGCTDTLFSGEPKRMDKCTDTEEDHLLEEPDIQYSSKVTQHPSSASSIAESKSSPGSDRASSPEGPEVVYVPAEPTQLAAHVLGNSDSLYSVRDVATTVQTLQDDSQTSEDEFTPVESAAEDASAVPAAEASVEAVRSQPGAQSLSSVAGELGPSDSQADESTNDVNQASSIPLWEEPSPPPLSPPSPAPKDPLQAVPSSSEAEVTSTPADVSLCWDDEPIMGAEALPYVEQFPQKIIIPFIDRTAYLVKIEQPLNAGRGSSATSLSPYADDLVCQLDRTESPAQMESAERVYVMSAMASSEAGQPPPHSNVWTLYCLTDLREGQKSPPSLPPAGAGVPYSQATLHLSRGEDQQCGQLSQVSAPIYVMQEDDSTKGKAPPFILVGSKVQPAQDWKPVPHHAVSAQPGAGGRRRFITVPVPVARPADEETDTASPASNSAEGTGAKPRTADVFLVAIPLDDVMSAKTQV